MSHPIHLIKRYYADVEGGKYARIREELEGRDPFHEGETDPNHVIEHLVRQNAQVIASRARIIDKLNLIREIVASGMAMDKGETLSDDDYVMVLAGWAAEMRGRFRA